jgi:hypothetical protein
MAFGTNSKVFIAYCKDVLENTTAMDANSDTINVALYGNTGTPDNTVSAANSAYNAGQWVTGNETTATGWPAGGLALASVTSASATNVYTFDAADRAGGASDTVTNSYGCLVYDFTIATPVVKQGMCYNAFGGANSVTSGTFTVVWNALGIFTFTAN